MLNLNGAKSNVIPQDLLDDIASRFILDAPDSELNNPISLCFLTELAYWFYLDEYVEENSILSSLKFDSFALQLLQHVKIKPTNGGSLEEMLQDFRDFKHRVPTYGALILSSDLNHVLLVQGFWHRASWGFPKGKINVNEEPFKCAIREVLEETGYDITAQINKDSYLESTIGEQKVRLYIIPNVPMETEFIPQTKGEIKELRWFAISQLPTHKNDRNYPKNAGTTNMFYTVMPFVKPLREWLAMKVKSRSAPSDKDPPGKSSRRRHRSLNANLDSYPRIGLTSGSPLSGVGEVPKGKSLPYPATSTAPESLKSGSDASPRKRETRARSKGKKGNATGGSGVSMTEDHIQAKFSFKSRSKSKNSHTSQSSGANTSQAMRGNSSSAKPVSQSSPFRSYSWQNFKINKRALNEALDKVWHGVTLEIKG